MCSSENSPHQMYKTIHTFPHDHVEPDSYKHRELVCGRVVIWKICLSKISAQSLLREILIKPYAILDTGANRKAHSFVLPHERTPAPLPPALEVFFVVNKAFRRRSNAY